ncbi:metacaspase-1 [Azospirillaceae bacterium]
MFSFGDVGGKGVGARGALMFKDARGALMFKGARGALAFKRIMRESVAAAVVAWSAVVFFCGGGVAFSAEIHALVVGVDDYQHVSKLSGASNDARDIAQSLTKMGVKDVRLLLDKEVTRDAILNHWKDIIAKATPGSTLIFSFAGHGSQSPELVKGSEPDHLDEFLVLSGFDSRGAGVHERLIDDDIGVLLEQASKFNVLFVADACHSGTMTRGLDPRGEAHVVRALPAYGPLDDDPDILPDPHAAAIDIAALKHVTYFGAVQDNEEAQEVSINGQRRGALSWAFARAIGGEADANGDGVISKEEMERFIRENVRMKMQGQQHPSVTRGGLPDEVAISVAASSSSETPRPAVVRLIPSPLPFRLLNLPSGVSAVALMEGLTGVSAADAQTSGRFTWDVAKGEVVDALGDVVAEVKTGDLESELSRVQGVVDKWAALRALEGLAERRSLVMRVEPDDRRYRRKDRVTLTVEGNHGLYFTLFNLAADGTINYLYPVNDGKIMDSPTIPPGGPYRLTLEVTPPFGADHFVAIAAISPMDGLQKEIQRLDGKQESAQVLALLNKYLSGATFELGLHGVYTGKN